MNAKTKKTILILLTVIFILSTFSFIGCAPENVEPIYKQELVIYPYMFESNGNVNEVVLTNEENVKEQYIGIYPYAFLSISAHIKVYKYAEETGEWLTMIDKPLLLDSDIDWKYTYVTTNVDNEEKERFLVTDTLLIDAKSKERGFVLLFEDAIEHRITYSIPKIEKYNIEEMEYEINFTLTNDKRKKQAEICLINSDAKKVYTAEQVGKYDVYTVESKPNFCVIDIETKEIIEKGSMTVSYRKFDAIFGTIDENIAFQEKGVYFCYVTYGKDSTRIFDESDYDNLYRVTSYACYIIYV